MSRIVGSSSPTASTRCSRCAAGSFVEAPAHWRRLARSLSELQITPPMTGGGSRPCRGRRCCAVNRIIDGLLYLQVTRGAARRDFPFPAGARPTLVMTARSQEPSVSRELVQRGVAVITLPDIRWRRRDIKSVALLANVLAKQQAKEAGAYEAWLIDEAGRVTEGASSNAWIVSAGGELITAAAGSDIPSGVTRAALIDIAQRDANRQISLRASVHIGGSLVGARGLPHQLVQHRAAGGADRRQERRRRLAGAARDRAARSSTTAISAVRREPAASPLAPSSSTGTIRWSIPFRRSTARSSPPSSPWA